MSTPTLCFLSGQPATQTLLIPSQGWGEAYTKASEVEVSVCDDHKTPPVDEQELVDHLTRFSDKNAPRPGPEVLHRIWPWLDRLARAIFYQVYQRPWVGPLVLVSGRLGVPPEAKELYEELTQDLKEPIFELFPEPAPFKKLDYHFFEVEQGQDEDSVLWIRLPGGLVVYVYPGKL
jgi:hypothetical protein